MKTTLATILFALTLSLSAAAQTPHAPSIQQCRADFLLWNSQDKQPDAFDHLSYLQLDTMLQEMVDCDAVDPANDTHYWNMVGEFNATKTTRMAKFIRRHGLTE